MTTSNHASAGTQVYGYNHVNQRVFVRNGNTVTYYLYGLGGERLMEFQETCNATSCTNYTETQRWIYFAGRKMFSKTGTTLKAITPNRLASEAKHFPYGETYGTPPADTKDYFATYRRDTTSLDYAWNRYYSPTMGRFTTADPYEASAAMTDPQTWNRYAYVANDPISRKDRNGLWMTSVHNEYGDGYYICGISLWENPFSGWANICGYGPFSEEMFYLQHQDGLGGGTQETETEKRFRLGFDDAAQRLGNTNCANLFKSSSVQVQFSALGVSSPAELLGAYKKNGWITFGTIFTKNGGGQTEKFSSLPGSYPETNIGGVTTYASATHMSSSGVNISVNRIALNTDSFVFTGMMTVNGRGGTQLVDVTKTRSAFTGMTQTEVTSSAIIHELLHAVGAIPSDGGNPSQSDANSKLVRKNCF